MHLEKSASPEPGVGTLSFGVQLAIKIVAKKSFMVLEIFIVDRIEC